MAAKKPPIPKKNNGPLLRPGASEKPYSTIFEHAGLPTIIIEKDSTISLANRTFLQLSRLPPAGDRGKEKMD